MSLFSNGVEVRFVKARTDYKCWACGEILPKGHKYVYHQCLDEKEIITTKLCEPCYVGLVSFFIEFNDVDEFPPPDIVEENKLKSGDTVKLLDDCCGLYDDNLISLKNKQEWRIIDIEQKSTSGMYARICTNDGKSTAYSAYKLSNLIKIFKD